MQSMSNVIHIVQYQRDYGVLLMKLPPKSYRELMIM